MALIDRIKAYQGLLDRKELLAEETKENNAAIEAAKQEIAQQMVDDDCPQIAYNGYSYSLAAKTAYTKRSDAELMEQGVDFLATLREEGLGDLIVETVNPRTLQSAMKAYVEENGGLSDGLSSVVRSYDFNDVTRRKSAAKRKG